MVQIDTQRETVRYKQRKTEKYKQGETERDCLRQTYTHTHTHTERERERQRERERNRVEKEINRVKEIQKDREKKDAKTERDTNTRDIHTNRGKLTNIEIVRKSLGGRRKLERQKNREA